MIIKSQFKTLDDVLKCKDVHFRNLFWISRSLFVEYYTGLYDLYKIHILEQTKDDLLFKLLLFFNYVKQYPTTRVMSAEWNRDQKTLRKYLTQIIQLLNIYFSDEKHDNIRYEDRLKHPPFTVNDEMMYTLLNTSFFRIQKPNRSELEKLYYSAEHKMHGIKFETLVCCTTGKICCAIGPHIGSKHDITIFRENLKNFERLPNEKILAGLGYRGDEANTEDIFVIPKNGLEDELSLYQKTINDLYHSVSVIVENGFARLKKPLNILNLPWRGDIEEFGDIIFILFLIYNRILDIEPLRK